MYLKRFVYDRLLDWKNEGGHSTLEVGVVLCQEKVQIKYNQFSLFM